MRRVSKSGLTPDESEEPALRRESLVLMTLGIQALAFVWVITYAALDLYVAAMIPLVYQIIAGIGLVYLVRGGRFEVFTNTQLGLMLVLPGVLQWTLGGFQASSGVMLWSLTAPLGALVFSSRPTSWFLGYVALTLVSGALEPSLDPAPIPRAVTVTFFVLNILAVSGVVYFLLRYFMHGLDRERRKTERLLSNLLPASIARRLKAGESPLADRFDEAAVLFADLVGFTPMSEKLDPSDVVDLLDDLFRRFDALVEQHGLEKIKTVGDAYMAVSGLGSLGTGPVDAIADAALEMRQLTSRLRSPDGEPLQLRVGIDIGPVTAGVIGTRKYVYDLWGDTVNTASRMESHGLPGEIQVTDRAHEKLAARYEFRPRGMVDVKGKGPVSTYLLVGRKDSAAPARVAGHVESD